MQEMIARLAETPLLQGALVAAGSVVGEDATMLASGLLVAGGQIPWATAFFGLWFGILLGDWLLYGLGRFLGPRVRQWNLVDEERLRRAEGWFERHGLLAVVVARCVPGLRLPTFVAAGALGLRPTVYLPATAALSFAWTVALLYGVSRVGEALLPLVQHVQWLFLGTLVLLLANVAIARRSRRRARLRAEALPAAVEAAS